jgi:hypothetical protein
MMNSPEDVAFAKEAGGILLLGTSFFFPLAKWPLKNNHWDDHILQEARKKKESPKP